MLFLCNIQSYLFHLYALWQTLSSDISVLLVRKQKFRLLSSGSGIFEDSLLSKGERVSLGKPERFGGVRG